MLVLDDDSDDRQLIQHAINEAGIVNPVQYFESGEELFELLVNATDIGIIILDLHLGGMDGYDVLKYLKQNSEWRKIPAIVLSTSDYVEDVKKIYELGAAGYIIKPASFSRLVAIMQAIKVYWFESVVLAPT